MNADKTIAVTGGSGFLGKEICFLLKDKGYKVISLSRKKCEELEEKGIKSISCNIVDRKDLSEALKGAHAVIHTAAKAGIWGREEDFYRTNVEGTKNLIEACKENAIDHLVYTSSPSVCFNGEDIKGANESIPYASRKLCPYAHSKQLAEAFVFERAKQSSLKVTALRPHLIWGPGDPHFLPRLKEKALSGKLFQVGRGDNFVDIIYVKNAANAHIGALEKLFQNNILRGQAYFLGQEEPVNLWGFLNKLLKASSLPSVTKKLPFSLAYAAGVLNEKIFKALKIYEREPRITPFLALQLGKSHYFDHQKARTDFGYRPSITTTDGLNLLSKSLKSGI
jgi:nucleoside-diphosphate-sugar epimerase